MKQISRKKRFLSKENTVKSSDKWTWSMQVNFACFAQEKNVWFFGSLFDPN